ncbi:unnamed protein product [Urochloa decumbens]|uniref:Uncharacterized protein n=1 Tax=Urochloa decumbens TaxID=240449 RepID=A0ABC8VVY3_9POAL
MEFATVGLSALLPKLAKLLQDEYNLQKGAKEGIQFLYKELQRTQAVLREVGEVPLEQLSELVRLWARDVREVSYDMEDIVDTFTVRVQGSGPPSKRSVKRFIKKVSNIFNEVKTRCEVTKEINDIKKRVMEVAQLRDRYKNDGTIAPIKKTLVDPRITAMYTKDLVGIDEAKEEVIAMLTKGDSALQESQIVVSIAGFGGLGKTTLARAVHDEIKGQFHCTAFVSVSRCPDAKKILKDIMYELHMGGPYGADSDEIRHLIDLVRNFLQNKRYLIVIDDIWDKEPWDKVIRLALSENNMGSRIIITTRNIDVAEHAGDCYRLKPLSDESSEKLFYERIFSSKDKCPSQFSEVSKKILKKCGGVPLAIVTTSSMLANKSDNIKEWNKVCDSIGLGLGRKNSSMDDMRKILLLSYYDLPSHLKTCLLYLSIFPEDYKIEKERLICRWVAEGFVQQAPGDQSFLEIGENYFNELLNRSMIQPVDMDDLDGTPHACRVHDSVLDLIISLSVGECFITTVFDDRNHSLETNQVRRFSLHNTTTWPTLKMPKLRSLTIFKLYHHVVIDPTPSLSRYPLLRVLDLRSCYIVDLASLRFLESLSHLRYLGLSSTHSRRHGRDDPDQFPLNIGRLRFLQTLDLWGPSILDDLVRLSVIGLGQLMCLRCHWSGAGMTFLPDGLKNLTSLEVLERLVVTSECIAEELGHLNQLRVLDIIVLPLKDGNVDQIDDDWRVCNNALVKSLGKLTKIESLKIDDINRGYNINIDGSMEEPLSNLRRLWMKVDFLPTWIKPALLPSLCYLHIDVRIARGKDIQVLGTLPCLRHLIFRAKGVSALESCVVLGPDAFPCAVKCDFSYARGLVLPCMFPRGAMPKLQHFNFKLDLGQFLSGGKFTADDLCLGHLPSLRSVTVGGLYHGEYENRDDMVIRTLRRDIYKKVDNEEAVHPNSPLDIYWK